MNQDAILWMFGIVITVQLAVVGFIVKALWDHVEACKVTASSLASLNTNVARIMVDIGSHESGLRGQTHDHAGVLTQHEMRIEMLERGRIER